MNAAPTGRDKRQHERYQVTSLKHIWNLSEGGAYIATESPKRLGSKVHMEFKLGEGGPTFHALAKVIRVLHKPNPKLHEPAGMAVQFVEIGEDQAALLRQYLKQFK